MTRATGGASVQDARLPGNVWCKGLRRLVPSGSPATNPEINFAPGRPQPVLATPSWSAGVQPVAAMIPISRVADSGASAVS